MHVLNSNQMRGATFPGKAYRHKTDNPLAQFGRRGKISCVRQGRSPTEQIGNLLATLWNVAHDFVNQRFTNMDGATPASSADRPNAGTNLVDEAPGVSVPLFEVFRDKCSTPFKVLDKAKLPGAKQEELISLVCPGTANANAGPNGCCDVSV